MGESVNDIGMPGRKYSFHKEPSILIEVETETV